MSAVKRLVLTNAIGFNMVNPTNVLVNDGNYANAGGSYSTLSIYYSLTDPWNIDECKFLILQGIEVYIKWYQEGTNVLADIGFYNDKVGEIGTQYTNISLPESPVGYGFGNEFDNWEIGFMDMLYLNRPLFYIALNNQNSGDVGFIDYITIDVYYKRIAPLPGFIVE